jgi:hypothetical protein
MTPVRSDLSFSIDPNASYPNGNHPDQRESNDSGDSDKDGRLSPRPSSISDQLFSIMTERDPSLFFPGILTRLGKADHEGWMRKKGGALNSWKVRYFVLKGPDLYWLRSDSVFVSVTLADEYIVFYHLYFTGDPG